MRQVEETHKALHVREDEWGAKNPINNGGVSAADDSTKRKHLAWVPALALIVAVGVLILIL